jgi:hypothetical protein
MPFSSGTYSLPSGNPVVTGTTISSTTTNTTNSDIATALSSCILKDGTQTVTANIPMASHKFTGLSAGTTAGDSVEYGGSPSFTNLAYTGTLTGSTGVLAIGTNQIYKDASGNVGIGTIPTSIPATGNPVIGANNLIMYNAGNLGLTLLTDNAATRTQQIGFGSQGLSLFDAGLKYDNSSRSLQLWTGSSVKMTIDSSGNVGIGTSSPTASTRLTLSDTNTFKLKLTGGTTQNAIKFDTAGTANTYYLGAGNNLLSGGDKGFLIYDDTNGRAKFYVEDTAGETRTLATTLQTFYTNASERMRIDSSGNVGIGTTADSGAKMKISGATAGSQVLYVVNTTGSGNQGGIRSFLGASANNTSSFHFNGLTDTVANWYLYGNGTSSWSSDERLKKNIETTREGYINDVMKLRVVKYNWKNAEEGTPKELGLIAQEVEQVFPGLVQDDFNNVSEDDPIFYKQLKGSVLPMILLKTIQEQQTLIEALTARLTKAGL